MATYIIHITNQRTLRPLRIEYQAPDIITARNQVLDRYPGYVCNMIWDSGTN